MMRADAWRPRWGRQHGQGQERRAEAAVRHPAHHTGRCKRPAGCLGHAWPPRETEATHAARASVTARDPTG